MHKKLLSNKSHAIRLVLKHLVVSFVCATVDFAGFGLAFYYLRLSIAPSYLLAFCAATTIGFFGHSYFTFNVGKMLLKNAILFIFQASLSLFMGFLILKALIGLDVPVMLSKLIQLGITFFFNVGVGRYITFQKRPNVL